MNSTILKRKAKLENLIDNLKVRKMKIESTKIRDRAIGAADLQASKNERVVLKSETKSFTTTTSKQNQPHVSVSSSSSSLLNDLVNHEQLKTQSIRFYDDFIDFKGDILHRPSNAKNCRILWEYLFILLQDNSYRSVIRWEDDAHMVFRIVQAEKLAALWGLQKNRVSMTYEKLSRGMRYYYPNNIIAREPGRRLIYRFMRHPNEIKKFVRKNGIYMMKRGKINIGDENRNAEMSNEVIDECGLSESLNLDDSGMIEPTKTMMGFY